MQIVLLVFLNFIISLFESTFINLPLTLLTVISFGVLWKEDVFLIAFFAGIFLDLLAGRVLGVDSLFFLIVIYIIHLYRKKLEAHTLYYLIPYTTLLIIIYNFIFYKVISISTTILSLFSGVIIFWLISYIWRKSHKGESLDV